MRRLIGGVVVALVMLATVASASNIYMKAVPVSWRTSISATTTAGGGFDSLAIALGGVTDTTKAISLSDYAWEVHAGSLSGNTQSVLRVYLTTPNVGTYTTGDSLTFVVDGSYDGVNWYTCLPLAGIVISGTTPKVMSFVVATIDGGTNAVMFPTVKYQRFIRLRISAGASHTFTAARCYVYYPALR